MVQIYTQQTISHETHTALEIKQLNKFSLLMSDVKILNMTNY